VIPDRSKPRQVTASQRSQEANQLLLLRGAQVSKASSGVVCFTLVALDCVVKRQRPQVVHEAGLRAQTPERRSPQFVRSVLRPDLDDSISRSDVMQQEVAKRMLSCALSGWRVMLSSRQAPPPTFFSEVWE